MENFLKTNTLNKRFDFDTDNKYSPTPDPVTFAHKKVEVTGSLTQSSVSDTNSELEPALLDHKLAKRITESHHNPANLTLTHTKPTLNWVKFLDNPDTLREQLFKLTTLKDLMVLHLKQITPPISESLLPLLSRQFPTLGRLWDNHTFLHQDAILTQKLRKLWDNDISTDRSPDFLKVLEEKLVFGKQRKETLSFGLKSMLVKEADALFNQLFENQGLAGSTMETIGSSCQFLANHGLPPAIFHTLHTRNENKYFLVIPSHSHCFLVGQTSDFLPEKQYISDRDLMLLSQSGTQCSVFIKTHLLNYRTALSRTLQIVQFPNLPELYEYIEVNTPRPGSITEVMGRLVFLETDDARVKMEGADRNNIPMLKFILASPLPSDDDEEEWWSD